MCRVRLDARQLDGKRLEALILYARQLGHLHARPKGADDKPKESRITVLRRRGEPVPLPELDGGEYLVEAMLRLGPMRQTGFGLRPADWTEIDAFVRLTQRVSEPWEAEALFEMCAGYCAAYEAGEDLLAEAPMGKAETDISE